MDHDRPLDVSQLIYLVFLLLHLIDVVFLLLHHIGPSMLDLRKKSVR